MRSRRLLARLALLGLIVWALGSLRVPAQAPAGGTRAVAIVRGFTNPDIQGVFTLVGEGKSVRVTGEVRGLPPKTTLAIHVHEWGDCRNPDAPGAHFDPHKSGKHGHPNDPVGSHHAGDLPNLETDDQGVARLDFTTQAFTLDTSPTSVIGRALIIHEKADDYTSQPAGAAGGRVACGVIGWAK